MKKNTTLILLVTILLFAFTACHHRRHHKIVMSDNNTYLKLEYTGRIALTEDETAIEALSPNGYFTLKYSKNDRKLLAQSTSNGNVQYKFYKDGERTAFDDEGKAMLREAMEKLKASL